MKLYSSPATPFGRKAAIVAREHGIALDIVTVNPSSRRSWSGSIRSSSSRCW